MCVCMDEVEEKKGGSKVHARKVEGEEGSE